MDWSSFLAAGTDRAVRPLLPQALALMGDPAPGIAVDLGSGDGTESRYLAENGWRVHAFDGADGAEERASNGLPAELLERLDATQIAFEDIRTLPAAGLLYAGRSLPFCAETHFAGLWRIILESIEPGGWFVGDFFGPNDSWAGRDDMNFHGRTEV
ncbi:MAG: class I SAM-dependent methyltransferase, partial [Lacisediminihabitans sp.]